MKLKGRHIKLIIGVILVIAIVAIFLTFFYHQKCKNIACWEYKLERCGKAVYINDDVDVTWKYTIQGKSGDNCLVDVTALQIKRGLKNTEVLEGKTMTCALPIGAIVPPEKNPGLCHGALKEEMQNLIILKLHEYILEKIGEISGDFAAIPGVITTPVNITTNINNVTNTTATTNNSGY